MNDLAMLPTSTINMVNGQEFIRAFAAASTLPAISSNTLLAKIITFSFPIGRHLLLAKWWALGKSCRYHLEGYGPQLFWRHSQHTVSCGLAYTGLTKGCHEGHYSI